jgi:hypothetical protein
MEHKVCSYCKSQNETVRLTLVGTNTSTKEPIFKYICSLHQLSKVDSFHQESK